MYDRCSALHRAIEGNQFKLIPLLLTADPNIVNIQDKNGQSALHRACHQNLKKCILALCVSNIIVNIMITFNCLYNYKEFTGCIN